jgi:hypothetical protein
MLLTKLLSFPCVVSLFFLGSFQTEWWKKRISLWPCIKLLLHRQPHAATICYWSCYRFCHCIWQNTDGIYLHTLSNFGNLLLFLTLLLYFSLISLWIYMITKLKWCRYYNFIIWKIFNSKMSAAMRGYMTSLYK